MVPWTHQILKKGYYVIKLFSEVYTLQKDTTYYGQIITASELFYKAHDLRYIQERQSGIWRKIATTSHICSNTHYSTAMYCCICSECVHYIPISVYDRKNINTVFTKTSYMSN